MGKGPIAKPKKVEESPRKVIHPTPRAEFHYGDQALTVEEVKKLLGYEEEPEAGKWDLEDPAVIVSPVSGKKFKLGNNVGNRPFYYDLAQGYMQNHLNKEWKENGEPAIIGKTGATISMQHRGVGLIWAEEARTGADAAHWGTIWDGPVTWPTLLVFGISEDDLTVNTIDTGKSRSLPDVIYRSHYFPGRKPKEKRVLAAAMDAAVRTLWRRTGQLNDKYNKRKTHAEALAWIARHPRLEKAVLHVFEENGEEGRVVKAGFKLGEAAAAMYLMASAETDGKEYRKGTPPTEMDITWDRGGKADGMWDLASEFWMLVATRHDDVEPLTDAIGSLYNAEASCGGTPSERFSLLSLAWDKFRKGEAFTKKDLDLSEYYGQTKSGKRVMAEIPPLGGIDLGDPKTDERVAEILSDADKDDEEDVGEDPDKKPAADQPPVPTAEVILQAHTALKDQAGADRTVLVKNSAGNWTVWADDAIAVAAALGQEVGKHTTGVERYQVAGDELESTLEVLFSAGLTPVLAEKDPETKVYNLTEVTPTGGEVEGPAPEPEKNGKKGGGGKKPKAAAAPATNGKPAAPKPKKAKKGPKDLRGGTEK